ncbi:class I SAM-dependent methyltransferase [Acuticoccus sp. M5D2P5]|uniref:class I SAM-dependent methyltransferase n=1 Tax=Acuticoccus kalidii TaxID=2910977 RepID=UPI001F1DFEB5|nr:class I SAM-dependent methyltransferase [Acuticoccus kalidii]MCF3933149.1 class I SAM-dependent methyltransferase [Acuticoccus kalidii]
MSYSEYTQWKGWEEGNFAKYDQREALFYGHEVASLLASKQPTTVRVFEIGFGNGSFLAWARDQGYAVSGSEIQDSLKARAVRRGFDVVDDLDSIENHVLDVIVAFDVFEHIEYYQLVGLCKTIKRKLKADGYLVARFPNGDSPFSLPIQNSDPTHVHAIGSGKIREVMRQAQLRIMALRAPTATPIGLKATMADRAKRVMRSGFNWYARTVFLGRSGPNSFEINYLLVAQNPAGAPDRETVSR